MQCTFSQKGRHLYVDPDTRQACWDMGLIAGQAFYHQVCQQIYAASGRSGTAGSALATVGHQAVRGLLSETRAAEISAVVTRQIGETNGAVTHIEMDDVLKPLMLEAMHAALSDEMEALLEGYYGSYFRVVYCQLYRTEPGVKRHNSFRWHRDIEPMSQVHIMLYLTPSAEGDGATDFLDFDGTRRLAAEGYAFNGGSERVLELTEALPADEAPPTASRPTLAPGDAAVFAAPRILHRGIKPEKGYRDVFLLNIIPSLVPWRHTIEEFGDEHLFLKGGGSRNTLMADPFDPLMARYDEIKPGPIEMPPWAMFSGLLPD